MAVKFKRGLASEKILGERSIVDSNDYELFVVEEW